MCNISLSLSLIGFVLLACVHNSEHSDECFVSCFLTTIDKEVCHDHMTFQLHQNM
jgi:hypothetical protein